MQPPRSAQDTFPADPQGDVESGTTVAATPFTVEGSGLAALTLEDPPPEALATEFALALFDFVFTWAHATTR